MMFLLPFLFSAALAVTFDEIKRYNCYTLRDRYDMSNMKCAAVIDENRMCEEMGIQTGKTMMIETIHTDGFYVKGLQFCNITFAGRCASETFEGNAYDLCLTTRKRNYKAALANCEKNGGSLYVPDSDNDLSNLIDLIGDRIRRFWIGGGSIFARTCREPSMGSDDEMAVMYTITEENDQFLGYMKTRKTSAKASYICAAPRTPSSRNCLSLNNPIVVPSNAPQGTHNIAPPPPRCSFAETLRAGEARVIEACFPKGSLGIGDKLVLEGVTPDCCPKITPEAGIWSINLYSKDKAPWLYMGIKTNWKQLVFSSAVEGWGTDWTGTDNYYCPLTPNSNFTMELINNQEHFTIDLNGQRYFVDHHIAGDHGIQYYYLALLSYSPVKIHRAAIISNGIWENIGLGVAA